MPDPSPPGAPADARTPRSMPARLAATVVAAALVVGQLLGCTTTTEAGAVGATRSQLMLISSEQIEQLAVRGYQKLTSEAAEKGSLNPDPWLTRRVRSIAERIVPKTVVFRRDALAWQWEVNVIGSEELNAFCMAGGKIAVHSGLVSHLNLSDDELAIVIGHEISHALREHAREQVSQAIAAQTLIVVGALLMGLENDSADAASSVYESVLATGFSRVDEQEADRMGLELAARAGYDPRAGVSLWKKMIAAKQGSRQPEFLSTHPADVNRIREVESLLPIVMPLYEAARRR